jgi:hypothetical protein
MGMFCQILPDTFTYSAICRGNCQPGKIHWQVGRLLPTTLSVYLLFTMGFLISFIRFVLFLLIVTSDD